MNQDKKTAGEMSPVELIYENKLKWMTSKEAAFYLRMSVGELRNRVWLGKFKAYHCGRRLKLLRSDLDQSMKPNF
jgi:excisionase family DNA binding protein